MLRGEQFVMRSNGACGVSAPCLVLSLFGLNLSFSLKRESVDAIH
jgi:hypothetical protein